VSNDPAKSRYFAAECPEGHKHAYDKVECCSKTKTVLSYTGSNPEVEIWLQCPQCDTRFKVKIDCEGFSDE
jgi:hypothetical protein